MPALSLLRENQWNSIHVTLYDLEVLGPPIRTVAVLFWTPARSSFNTIRCHRRITDGHALSMSYEQALLLSSVAAALDGVSLNFLASVLTALSHISEFLK